MTEADYQELEFADPIQRDKAAGLTMAAVVGIKSILIPTDQLEPTLVFLNSNGYEPTIIPSAVTNDDMWPAWPGDSE